MMILDVFNKSYTRITNISTYSYCKYTEQLNNSGNFEIWMMYDSRAKQIFQEGYFILFTKEVCGIITYKNPSIKEETGETELILKGFLMNSILDRRCIYITEQYSGTPVEVVTSMLNTHAISPIDTKRELPITLNTPSPDPTSSSSVELQITGEYLKGEIESVLDTQEMGYRIKPTLSRTALTGFTFNFIKGADRTIGNTAGNLPVFFSKELKNVLESTYIENINDYKNAAFVAGEGEGTARTIVEAGETTSEGLDRFELYVDARDIQSDSTENPLTPQQYQKALNDRGEEKLLEHIKEKSYAATIDSVKARFVYGVDYWLGDYVSVKDETLGISFSAQITEVTFSSLGEREMVDVTFGRYKLSTAQKLKRNGVI